MCTRRENQLVGSRLLEARILEMSRLVLKARITPNQVKFFEDFTRNFLICTRQIKVQGSRSHLYGQSVGSQLSIETHNFVCFVQCQKENKK